MFIRVSLIQNLYQQMINWKIYLQNLLLKSNLVSKKPYKHDFSELI